MSKENPSKAERRAAAKEATIRAARRRETSTKHAKEDSQVEKPSWLFRKKRKD